MGVLMPTGLPTAQKPLEWIGSSKKDLTGFPEEVQDVMGYALFLAQAGAKHEDVKPLSGDSAFRGAGVLEILDNFEGDTYRAVYTLEFDGVIYVLHAFQKKSKRGKETPKPDIDLIKARLKVARAHYANNYQKKAG
jgi:phage-related protein